MCVCVSHAHLAVKLRVLVEGVVQLQGALLQADREDRGLHGGGRPQPEVLLLEQKAQLLHWGLEKREGLPGAPTALCCPADGKNGENRRRWGRQEKLGKNSIIIKAAASATKF